MPSTDPNVVELEKELGRGEPLSPEAEDKNPSRWADPWVRRAAFGAAAVLAIAVVALLAYYHNRVSTDDAEVDGHIVPIASKISGTVAAVLINDNEPVKEGQVLVRIDPRDYQARVDQAKAALALAEARAQGGGRGRSADAGNHRQHFLRRRCATGRRPSELRQGQVYLREGFHGGVGLSRAPTWRRSKPTTIVPRRTWPA